MNRFLLYLAFIIIYSLLFFNYSSAQWVLDRKLADSLIVDQYKAMHYYYPYNQNMDDMPYGYQYEIYMNGRKILSSLIWPFMGIYPCSFGDTACTFTDINGDGIRDIIFSYLSGGNDGADTDDLRSLDSVGSEIHYFDGLDSALGSLTLDDIDGDGLAAFCYIDLTYGCWPDGCAGSPVASLVWKWDDKSYRLANFKLGSVIIQKMCASQPDYIPDIISYPRWPDTTIHRFDANNGDSYPIEIVQWLLVLNYCGKFAKADSVFNIVWPDSVSGKQEFYRIFKAKMESSPHWKELQQSNW